MAVRRPKLVDNFIGTLKNGVTALSTQLVSDQFPSLGSFSGSDAFSTSNATLMVIADDSQGLFEGVLITGYNAGTNSVTVVRGVLGAARNWDAGAVLRVSATSKMLTRSATAAAAAALGESFIGEEVVDENGKLRKQTASQGFQPLARAMAGGVGAGLLGGYAPSAGQELLAQSLIASGVTSANGFFNAILPAGAFPNALLHVFATPKNAPDGTGQLYVPQFCQAYTDTTSATANQKGPVLQFGLKNYNNAAVGNTSVTFSVLAIGV